MSKTELEIELILPDVRDARDNCVTRLSDLIEARKGVDKVHLRPFDGDQPGRLCVHFDPNMVSVGEIRRFARQAGIDLAQRFGHLMLQTVAMHARRARKVKAQLNAMEGVLDAGVSVDGMIGIEFDKDVTDATTIQQSIKNFGIAVDTRFAIPVGREGAAKSQPHEHQHGGIFGENTELIFAIICGASLLIGWLIGVTTSYSDWIPWAFFAAAYVFGGYYIVGEAIEKLRIGRFEIDFLMIVAAIGAAFLGAWAEGALLLFLFAIGHALEHFAMGRARKAIESLAHLAPETATVRRNGTSEEVSVSELLRGDIVLVKPNERIPADGFVVQGRSSVNQAPITGESLPVDKLPVDDPQLAANDSKNLAAENRVFAGTINGNGALEIHVTRLSTESTLARVVQMVNDAETQKSPTQRFTDKFEFYFVPAILLVVVGLLFAFLIIDEPFSSSFYRAMAVLVAGSPCALAIATPSAVLSGIARAARGGVLVKGGGPLENLGRLEAIAFDKTGTLTEGKPRVTDVICYEGATEQELLANAIAVEALSDHPLAAAVVRDGNERLSNQLSLDAQDLHSITGRGIRATVGGQTVHVGKDDLFAEVDGPPLPSGLRATVDRLEAQGRTTMIVRRDGRYLGVIGLMDTPREAAKTVIARLRKLGIKRMIMISGDNQNVADAVASDVGIDESHGDLMPEQKVEAIRNLRRHQAVAMVGDGVNDAPAMANATVGIAMGAAGSDVALETADVALMADDLNNLPFAVGLSRQTSRIIRQNLWFALGMVAILVPATIFGLRLGFAVLLHEGSTVVVVFNALRLLIYRNPASESPK